MLRLIASKNAAVVACSPDGDGAGRPARVGSHQLPSEQPQANVGAAAAAETRGGGAQQLKPPDSRVRAGPGCSSLSQPTLCSLSQPALCSRRGRHLAN